MLTFDRSAELELFKRLMREPKLDEWLAYRLELEQAVLVQSVDIDKLRRAQGRAQLVQQMQGLLEAARKAP